MLRQPDQGDDPRHPAPYLTLLRINLSTLAVSHVVPGGAAVGGALGFRLLTRFGLSGTDAAFAIGHRLGGGAEPPAVGGVAGVHPRR